MTVPPFPERSPRVPQGTPTATVPPFPTPYKGGTVRGTHAGGASMPGRRRLMRETPRTRARATRRPPTNGFLIRCGAYDLRVCGSRHLVGTDGRGAA